MERESQRVGSGTKERRVETRTTLPVVDSPNELKIRPYPTTSSASISSIS